MIADCADSGGACFVGMALGAFLINLPPMAGKSDLNAGNMILKILQG